MIFIIEGCGIEFGLKDRHKYRICSSMINRGGNVFFFLRTLQSEMRLSPFSLTFAATG
jgi:hypothetical protein